jgi:TPR repeat protein
LLHFGFFWLQWRGECYAKGQGVKQDLEQAVSWYLCAATQGHVEAQCSLGDCYANGVGVSKDLTQAKHWYEKAAAQGNAHAKAQLGALQRSSTPPPPVVSHTTPSPNTPSSFFAASSSPKPDGKMEVKQTVPNLPPVTPQAVPQKSAAPVVVDEKALDQLLKCVAEGEQDQAEALIKKDPQLLLAAGKVTDLSGRSFENITAFQYALWAMDYHMWTMIQTYLPTEAQAKQHALLESKGTAHGKHFDLQPLLEALKTYGDNHRKWSSSRCQEQWCKKVGGAQKLLPAHVVNEYCRPDRSFDPCPAEWTSPLPRTRAVEVYIDSKWVEGAWFTPPTSSESGGLVLEAQQRGVRGASYRGEEQVCIWWYCPGGAETRDLESLQALWNARTQQLKLLGAKLAPISTPAADAKPEAKLEAKQAASNQAQAGPKLLALSAQSHKQAEPNAQQPGLLASVSLASNLHYQPQAVVVKAKSQEPPEEKSAGLEAFQKGYQLYGQGQYQTALPHLQQSAKEHYPPAYVYLGCIYEFGQGVVKDPGESAVWYGKAQAQKSWFIEQAGKGETIYQHYLGAYYQFAAGAKKDSTKAVTWYRRAAEQGHAIAQYYLGVCYADGQGVRTDLQQAKQWYEKAAAQGNEKAKTNLSSLLQVNPLLANSANSSSTAGSAKLDTKQGVHNQVKAAPKPLEKKSAGMEAFQKGRQLYGRGQFQKALPYFQEGAKNHYLPAYLYLGDIYGFGQGVAKDLRESTTWYAKAQMQEAWFLEQATKGDAISQSNLGCYYLFAAGTKKDFNKAVTWCRHAAEQGDAEAQYNLGYCYDAGKGVERDNSQAVIWFRRAAEQEIAFAQHALGACYQRGEGVAQNYVQAVSWYRRAAEQGYAAAQYNLGYCYETGRGLGKTPQLAKQWYEKAAAQSNEDAITALAALLKANPSLASNPSSFFASSLVKPDTKPDAKQAAGNQVQAASKPKPPPGKPFGK